MLAVYIVVPLSIIIDGWMYGYMNGYIYGWIYWCMDKWMDMDEYGYIYIL